MISGMLDVIPMLAQNLSWDANASAFSMWIIIGVFNASINWKINSILKGIAISFLAILPCAILIGAKEPVTLAPISIATLILGGFSGFAVDKTISKLQKKV